MSPGDPDSIWNRRTVPPTALVPGDEVGRFRIVELIGRGGMGEVWKAHDPVRKGWVVIKVLPREFLGDMENLERLQDSFRQIQGFQHQHICPVYDLNPDERVGWYLVMKFVEGVTLSYYQHKQLRQAGALPVPVVLSILRPIASALDYAHKQGVVHRDVKPQNILVADDGSDPQLVDFGLAATLHRSMSRAGLGTTEISGSYPYMAPEQWKGSPQDGRADQYALAVVAYELLAGHAPFDSPDASVMRMCVLQEPPPVIESQPETVHRVMCRALAKIPAQRYSSCGEFLEDLSAALQRPASSKSKTRPAAPTGSTSKVDAQLPPGRERKGKETAFTVALLVIACGLGWLFRSELFSLPRANTSVSQTAAPAAPAQGTMSPASPPVQPPALAASPAPTANPTTVPGVASSSPAPPPTVAMTPPSPPAQTATPPALPRNSPATKTTNSTPPATNAGTTVPAPAANKQLLSELNEARQISERAKQDSLNRNADQYAAKLWQAADTEKKSADELYAQGKFAEAMGQYRSASKGYYQSVTVADRVSQLASSTQKNLQQLKASKAQLVEQGADQLVPKEFREASQAHDTFLQAMQTRDYATAADALTAAEAGYEQCRLRAAELTRVKEAQAQYDQLVSSVDAELLKQFGGRAWSDATQRIEMARGTQNTPELEQALLAATNLLPVIREQIQDSEVDKWKNQGDHSKILQLLWPSWRQLKPPARKLCLEAAGQSPSWWLQRAESLAKDDNQNAFRSAMVQTKLSDARYRMHGQAGAAEHLNAALKTARNILDGSGSKNAYLASWASMEIAEDCLRRGDFSSAKSAVKQAKLDLDSMAEPAEHQERVSRPIYEYVTLLRCAAVYWAAGDKKAADTTAELAYERLGRHQDASSFYWDIPAFQAIFIYARSNDGASLSRMSKFFTGGTVRLSHILGGRQYQSLLFPDKFSDQGHNSGGNIAIYQMLTHAEMAIHAARNQKQDDFDLHRRKVEAMIDAHNGNYLNEWNHSEIHSRIAMADAMQGEIDSAVSRLLNKKKISSAGHRGSAITFVGRVCAEQGRFIEARQLFEQGLDDARVSLLAFEIARHEGAVQLENTLDWLADQKSTANLAAGMAGLSTIPAR